MHRSSRLWQWIGFALVTFGGTILHFIYDWTGQNPWAAPFSGINESTWEHMKLLYWPLFLYSLLQYPFFRGISNYWCVKLTQILMGLLLIPVIYYTYNGAFGKSPDWVNIAIFYVTCALIFLFERWAFKNDFPQFKRPYSPFIGTCAIGILFIVFTFYPPQLPLFQA